jgi:hypothetical protein
MKLYLPKFKKYTFVEIFTYQIFYRIKYFFKLINLVIKRKCY